MTTKAYLTPLLALIISGSQATPAHSTGFQASTTMPVSATVLPEYAGAYDAHQVTGAYENSIAMRLFIRKMVDKHHFSEQYLNGLFSRANKIDAATQLENTVLPIEPRLVDQEIGDKPMTDDYIASRVTFWHDNTATIKQANEGTEVDHEYTPGSVTAKTNFCESLSQAPIIDAITTLAFDTERRSDYFAGELESYLLMARNKNIDPRRRNGSLIAPPGVGNLCQENGDRDS